VKDTAANALQTGEFVWNMATYDQREQVMGSAQVLPAGVDEFKFLGIQSLPSNVVKPLRVAGSPVHFECKLSQSLFIPGNTPAASTYLLIGQVIGIHINDGFVREDGFLDVLKMRPLARVGYHDYISVDSTFELTVPDFKGHDAVPYLRENLPVK
jgi:flavin reductase (DIM6/NTAB) family NADH-FMN oxidoreductase RutF